MPVTTGNNFTLSYSGASSTLNVIGGKLSILATWINLFSKPVAANVNQTAFLFNTPYGNFIRQFVFQ